MGASPRNGLDRVAFDGAGDFLKTVRERVNTALPPDLQKGCPSLQRKSVLIAVWFLGSYIALFCVHSVWVQAALCFSYGLAASAVGFNIFHAANHGALSSCRRTN